MQTLSFYQHHLDQVSRSFSFCIMQLLSPAKEWIALSYLLCRVADTIEDSVWPDSRQQTHAFQQLKLFLNEAPSESEFLIWRDSFPACIPLEEKALLADLPLLLADLYSLPDNIRAQIIHTVSCMIDGMQDVLTQYKTQNTLSLPSLMATNQYCFFVAGIVGELLTHIYAHLIPEFTCSDERLTRSVHFGLFLQKINILKDQRSDELAGRFYVADRPALRDSLIENAREALLYIQSIPLAAGRTYRIFCAWSLFIGLASLTWIDKSHATNEEYKISSRETSHVMDQVKDMIDDNLALGRLFERYMPPSLPRRVGPGPQPTRSGRSRCNG